MGVTSINDSQFEKEILASSSPVLIDFWAEWCGPCRMLAPTLDQLATEMGDTVRIVKMNIDENPETPTQFGVRSIPTLMLFKDGKMIATQSGVRPKGALEEWIRSTLGA